MIEKLRQLGYRVEAAQQLDNDDLPTVYWIEGYGLAIYAAENDTETLESLIASHDDRVEQAEGEGT